ncbi:MAG: hypothetical protein SGBAC_006366 [Bacillariaceae sp.]
MLERARVVNELEIRRYLEQAQKEYQASLVRNRNQGLSVGIGGTRNSRMSSGLRSNESIGQFLHRDSVARASREQTSASSDLTPSETSKSDTRSTKSDTTSSKSDESQSGGSGRGSSGESGQSQKSHAPLPFAVGDSGVKDLRMVQDSTWESRFQDLEQFKREHGHCNVPRRYKGNPKLGVWVCSLRQQMTRGTLNKAKVERLNSIGFQWRIAVIKGAQINPQIAMMERWNQNFQLLATIKGRTGKCTVPTSNRKLRKWVDRQRRQMKQGKLPIEEQEKLTSIGFPWIAAEEASSDDAESGYGARITDTDSSEGPAAGFSLH